MIDHRSVASAFALSLAVAATLGSSAAAQPADQPNWMRDFVTSRVAAQNLRAIGTESAERVERRDHEPHPAAHRRRRAGLADGEPVPGRAAHGVAAEQRQAQFCGGTLVRPNMVVTAAHCSDFVTAAQVQVLTGTRRLDGTGDRRNVAAHHHPSGLEQRHLRQRRRGLGADQRCHRHPARHARDRGRAGRRRPARHRLGQR